MDLTMDTLKEEVRSAFSDAMAEVLKESQKPAIAKDLVDEHGEEKVDTAGKSMTFWKAVYDRQILGKTIADEILQTGANDQGGYTVPTVVAKEIAQEEYQASLVRQECTIFPQIAMTVTLPTLSSSVAVTYPDETASGGDTEPVLGSVTYSKKRAVCIVPITNDLLRSSVVDMSAWIAEEIGGKLGEDLDSKCFTDLSSPYSGILNVAGKSVTMDAGDTIDNLSVDYLARMIGQLKSTSLANSKWVMSPSMFAEIVALSNSVGTPIYLGPGLGVPATLFNYPILISDAMPSKTAGESASTACLFFGDLRKYRIGEDGSVEIAMSKDASVALGAGTVSAFQNDLTIIKGTRRVSANLAVVNAICKLETGS